MTQDYRIKRNEAIRRGMKSVTSGKVDVIGDHAITVSHVPETTGRPVKLQVVDKSDTAFKVLRPESTDRSGFWVPKTACNVMITGSIADAGVWITRLADGEPLPV